MREILGGPQLGYVFPIDDQYQAYLNLKGYKEFDAGHRADGCNAGLTFSISAAPPKQPWDTSRPIAR